MKVDFRTRAAFDGADYDDATERWTARIVREGTPCTLGPKHIVLATSVSGTPNIPRIAGIGNFKGPVLHSSQFKAGHEWAGRPVVVFGTATSAHDVCQELHAAGAEVTMVQRSPTMVVNVEPAQLYDKTYLGRIDSGQAGIVLLLPPQARIGQSCAGFGRIAASLSRRRLDLCQIPPRQTATCKAGKQLAKVPRHDYNAG